jgi:hypothetical protein
MASSGINLWRKAAIRWRTDTGEIIAIVKGVGNHV